jgi:hypothetical protein
MDKTMDTTTTIPIEDIYAKLREFEVPHALAVRMSNALFEYQRAGLGFPDPAPTASLEDAIEEMELAIMLGHNHLDHTH